MSLPVRRSRLRPSASILLVIGLAACAAAEAPPDADGDVPAEVHGFADADSGWVSLFNGRDLSGWTPKIRGLDLGEDPLRTFRVEDGLLTVSYEGYQAFDDRFGHLFHARPFSEYELRVEYRFIGEQARGGEAWALQNSGVMIHAQAPETMLRDQDFPISLEAQLLGGDGSAERPTANLCTPGTEVEIGGALAEAHCISSSSPTYHGDEWVMLELRVHGDSIVHLVDGESVLAYTRPTIGGGVVNGYDPAVKRDGAALTGGYIALQSESHPIQFRRVEVREIRRDR